MSVLVYIESPKGHIKKTGNEVAYYGAKVAESLGTQCIAVVIGKAENVGNLGKYGVSKVLHVNADQEIEFDSQALTSVIAQVASENGANTVNHACDFASSP